MVLEQDFEATADAGIASPHTTCLVTSVNNLFVSEDVLSEIFTFLPLRQRIVHVSRVCRQWRQSLERPACWEKLDMWQPMKLGRFLSSIAKRWTEKLAANPPVQNCTLQPRLSHELHASCVAGQDCERPEETDIALLNAWTRLEYLCLRSVSCPSMVSRLVNAASQSLTRLRTLVLVNPKGHLFAEDLDEDDIDVANLGVIDLSQVHSLKKLVMRECVIDSLLLPANLDRLTLQELSLKQLDVSHATSLRFFNISQVISLREIIGLEKLTQLVRLAASWVKSEVDLVSADPDPNDDDDDSTDYNPLAHMHSLRELELVFFNDDLLLEFLSTLPRTHTHRFDRLDIGMRLFPLLIPYLDKVSMLAECLCFSITMPTDDDITPVCEALAHQLSQLFLIMGRPDDRITEAGAEAFLKLDRLVFLEVRESADNTIPSLYQNLRNTAATLTHLRRDKCGAHSLAHIAHLNQITNLDLGFADNDHLISDEDARALACLSALADLTVACPATIAGPRSICSLSQLKKLKLKCSDDSSPFRSRWLQEFQQLENVRELHIPHVRARDRTDILWAHLACVPKLRVLWLSDRMAEEPYDAAFERMQLASKPDGKLEAVAYRGPDIQGKPGFDVCYLHETREMLRTNRRMRMGLAKDMKATLEDGDEEDEEGDDTDEDEEEEEEWGETEEEAFETDEDDESGEEAGDSDEEEVEDCRALA